MLFRIIGIISLVLFVWTAVSALNAPRGTPEPASLGQMLRRPAEFDGKLVSFPGRVGDRVSIMGLGGYVVEAEGRRVAVVGLATAPAVGEPVTVVGTFRMAMAAGGFELPVVVVR